MSEAPYTANADGVRLAEALKLRKGDVTIQSGETGRLKMVQRRGDSAQILARLETWVGKT